MSDSRKWNLMFNLYKILMLFIQKWLLISWDRSEIDLVVIQIVNEFDMKYFIRILTHK